MKLKQKQLYYITLGAGLLGAIANLWGLSLGVDSKGLLPAVHLSYIIMYILTIGVPAALYYFLRDLKGELPYKKLFPANPLMLIGYGTGAVSMVTIAIRLMMQGDNSLSMIVGIFGILAAGSFGLLGYFRFKQQQPHYLFHAVITIGIMMLLIHRYQHWNTQTQLQAYLPQLLALLFLMICFYQRSALDADNGKRRTYAFFNLGALFFCCVAAVGEFWYFYLGMGIWCFSNSCSLKATDIIPPMELPEEVLYCIELLRDNGHQAYVVGGCVRDHLMGLTPSDYDICTSATPAKICDLFERHKLVRNGEKHGTIGVVVAGELYEITTFRTEGTYSDARHPDQVEFVADIKKDLARRDFTVNAIAYCPGEGYVDPFGGYADLKAKVLRAVGDPQVRFKEDALRILRGIRFSVRFSLTPESKTQEAMLSCAPLMDQLAGERIYAELSKLAPLITAEQLLDYKPVFTQVFPCLLPPEEGQDPYPKAAKAAGAAPQELALRLAAMLHHLSKEDADAALETLKPPAALRNRVLLLIEKQQPLLTPDKKQLLHTLTEIGEEAALQLIGLQIALAAASGEPTAELSDTETLLGSLCQAGCCTTIKDLAITGSDILELGVQPGPHIGRCMQSLLNLVQEDILTNEKEELLEAAKDYLNSEEEQV